MNMRLGFALFLSLLLIVSFSWKPSFLGVDSDGPPTAVEASIEDPVDDVNIVTPRVVARELLWDFHRSFKEQTPLPYGSVPLFAGCCRFLL